MEIKRFLFAVYLVIGPARNHHPFSLCVKGATFTDTEESINAAQRLL